MDGGGRAQHKPASGTGPQDGAPMGVAKMGATKLGTANVSAAKVGTAKVGPVDGAVDLRAAGGAAPDVAVSDAQGSFPSAAHLRLLAIIPSIPLGGMERAALNVCRRLADHGAHVHGLAERRWGGKVQDEFARLGFGQTKVSLPAQFHRPATLKHARTMVVSALVTEREFAAAHRRERINGLLATSVGSAYFARRLARRSDTVSIFRIPNPPLVHRGGLKDRLDRAVWRTIGESFDHLVCNAHYTARLVAEASGRPDRVRVVRNYPPNPSRNIATPAPVLDPARRHIIFLGQIAHHKGVDVLLEAVQALAATRPDVAVTLAGPTIWRDDYVNGLVARIDAAGLSERVQLVGSIDDVAGLLAQGMVHVCPSISPGDSFPNVILDAKLAGLPSVVLPTAGLPEAVADGVDGLVSADHSPAALAAALCRLLDDPALAAAMGKAARASLDTRFDAGHLTATWTALFSSPDAPEGTAFAALAPEPAEPARGASGQELEPGAKLRPHEAR